MSGHASWVGKSSVEIVVWLEQKSQDKWCKLTRALFLMGSRNATHTKSLAVNPLVPATDEEKAIYAGGESNSISLSIDFDYVLTTFFFHLTNQ